MSYSCEAACRTNLIYTQKADIILLYYIYMYRRYIIHNQQNQFKCSITKNTLESQRIICYRRRNIDVFLEHLKCHSFMPCEFRCMVQPSLKS